MKHLIEFPLADGGSIFVEVEDLKQERGAVEVARPGEAVAKAALTFEDAFDKIKPAAGSLIEKIRSLSDAPDEVEVEFGLKLDAEVGAIIATTGLEANYKITLRWKHA